MGSATTPTVPSSSTRARAFDISVNVPMLSRERLTIDDFENGDALKPPRVEEVANALMHGKSIAVKGEPGSGKSAFAAWVHWIIETKNGPIADFFHGRDLQQELPEKAVESLFAASPIIIIDDVHLVAGLMRRLLSLRWVAEKHFLLIGRTKYMDRAALPVRDTVEIKDQDSAAIAEALARKYVPKDADREKILRRTRHDLVLTKWILEAVVVNNAAIDSSPLEAAIKKLQSFGENRDPDLLRLFCVLAAFKWVELSCPESFLGDSLGFAPGTLERLHEDLHETDRRQWGLAGDCALRLLRHPKLCELFLKALPPMGLRYRSSVLDPTCTALSVPPKSAEHFDFHSLVLGAAALRGAAELDSIEWRLIYGGRSGEYVNVARAGVELLVQGQPDISTLQEQIRRLKFAYGAANGERRVRGGQAAATLLNKLKERLSVHEMPRQPFADKGKYLYQEAYILRLNNAKEDALAKFRESSKAAEVWATTGKSPLHWGKAAMSRIASAAYRIDLAVFAPSRPGTLSPDIAKLDAIARELGRSAALLKKLRASVTDVEQQDELELYRQNALLHLAEAGGWLGRETVVDENLKKLSPGVDVESDVEAAIGLAKAAHALVSAQYEHVIEELDGQIEYRTRYAGEGVGKTAVMLVISLGHLQKSKEAEKMRSWILSRDCREDAGNRLAREWATQLGPITGAAHMS